MVLGALQFIQNLIHDIIATSGNLSSSETVHAGLSLVTSFYEGGTLWSLCKAMMDNLSWWTVGKLVLNIVSIAVEIIQPQSYLVQQLVAVAVWVTDAVTNLMGWIKKCMPPDIVHSIHASRLIAQMKAAGKTAKMLALSFGDQHKVMMALTAPIIYELQSPNPVVGAPHPLVSHMAALKSDAGLQQEHLDHPFVEVFTNVPADARDIAADLAPMFTIEELPKEIAGNQSM